MTRPYDPPPPAEPRPDSNSEMDEALLLDFLGGELAPASARRLEERLRGDPALAGRHERLQQVLGAERAFYEPVGSCDAARIAARIRSQVHDEESSQVAARKREAAGPRSRSTGVWARVLAFSVGLHVLVLGLIAFLDPLLEGGPTSPSIGPETQIGIYPSDPFSAYDAESDRGDFGRPYPQITTWDSPLISDDFVLTEQEVLAEELPEQLAVPHDAQIAGLDHPVGVVGAMTRRLEPLLKRRRLDLLGFNAQGTLRAVERGLAYLSRRQEEDGSFAAGSLGTAAARSNLEETSLALLAFLSDGHCSHARASGAGSAAEQGGRVVSQGVYWLRQALFDGAETDVQRRAQLAKHRVTELAPAAVALCEDYMLSYGWLSPHAAQVRAREIGELVARLRQEQDGESAAAFDEAVFDAVRADRAWSVWALDAAARARIVEPNRSDQRIFAAWVQSTADTSQSADRKTDGALEALAVGTALLYSERGADKPRFLTWSRTHAERLVQMLGAQGRARLGDPIGDTALILLALQVAYRTY